MNTAAKAAPAASEGRQRESLAVQEAPATYAAWKRVRIGDALKLINGRAFKPSEWSQQGRPIVRIQNLNDPDAPFNYYDGELADKFGLKKGDLLFAWSGTPGTSFGAHIWHGDDAWLNQHIFKVIFDEAQFDKRFLRYAINQNLNQYIAAAHGGAGLAHITKGKFEASTIIYPRLEEQRDIVAEIEKQFSRLDDAVTSLMRVKSKLKRYRASVLKFLYSGGSMSEQLPSSWQWTTIGEQFRVEVGATPSRKHSDYWGGSIPWVSSGEVQFRRVKQTVETISEKGLRNSSTKLNPAGSVLLAMIGQGRTRGQAAILDIEAANNQNCAAIWVSKTETPPEFVYYWFMSQYEATRRVGSGNNQQALNKSLVQRLPMPWPGSIAEQRRVVAQVEERLQVVEELEAEVRANLARSQYLRRASLQRAFIQRAEAGL